MYHYICVKFVLGKDKLSNKSYVYEVKESILDRIKLRIGQHYTVISDTGCKYNNAAVEICGYWTTYNKYVVDGNTLQREASISNDLSIPIKTIVNMTLVYDPYPSGLPSLFDGIELCYSDLNKPIWYGINNFGSLKECEVFLRSLFEDKKSKNKEENHNNKIQEGNKKMNLFKNYKFGKYSDDDVRMSFKGMAYRTFDEHFVVYDPVSQSLTDVTEFVMDNCNFLYVVPVSVKEVKVGDIIIFNELPVIVTEVHENSNKFSVVKPCTKEIVTILPEKNLFGFNFVSKIVSPFNTDMFGVCNENNPFGSMLPFMMMDNKGTMMEKVMLMQMMNSGNDTKFNPLMLMAMNSDESASKNDMLMMMAMANGMKNIF
jgi:aromatic ring-cleaving dioxygenase